jgi:hypothetical protein
VYGDKVAAMDRFADVVNTRLSANCKWVAAALPSPRLAAALACPWSECDREQSLPAQCGPYPPGACLHVCL